MIKNYFIEKSDGVFHAKKWNFELQNEIFKELFLIAKECNNKARLCLHPSANEKLQITYLALLWPYVDQIHCHPFKTETVQILRGEADHNIYNNSRILIKKTRLSVKNNIGITIDKGIWHNLTLQSKKVLILEIGLGPFKEGSTKNFN